MQMKRNKTAGKIVRVWMILRSNNSICYSASTSADLDRQRNSKPSPGANVGHSLIRRDLKYIVSSIYFYFEYSSTKPGQSTAVSMDQMVGLK